MSTDGFAVAVAREDGAWHCTLLADKVNDDLSAVLTALRQAGSTGAAVFALIESEDAFFAIVRPIPGGASLLVSDATAALDYDLAADMLDLLGVPIPDEEDAEDDAWAEGDLAILADFGVSEQDMQIIVDDEDLYPDEQLLMIAERCGFGEDFARAADIDLE